MKCIDRSGNDRQQDETQDKILKFLYKSTLGRILLKPLVQPWISNAAGVLLNSSLSRILIAPCDGKLSVYSVTKEATFQIKNTTYTLQSLLRSNKLAKAYEDGVLLLFRLTVDDYHRF